MNIYHAIFMGFLQGATEFLPISSSGHLVLAHIFFGIEEVGLTFDVALHMGTLLAVFIYFRADFLHMARALRYRHDTSEETVFLRRLILFLVIATIPAIVAALLFGGASETVLRKKSIVVTTLVAGGILLLWGERKGKHLRDFRSITFKDALILGLSQAIAIIPGVSRSGITMTAGLFRGLNRQSVARFSFLMSAPVIFGAGVYQIPAIFKQGLHPDMFIIYVTGFVTSAISGYLFIAMLLKLIKTRTFDIFAYYRFVLAGTVLLTMVLKG